jgi:sarcosine oxidase subunit alpha
MSATIAIRIDGRDVRVAAGISVAAAIAQAGVVATRRDVAGEPRAACCGMGVCFECRVRVDGDETLGCMARVAPGMEIVTDG